MAAVQPPPGSAIRLNLATHGLLICVKILVTGGAGFIGSHIVEFFQDKAEVKVLDNLRSGFLHNLAEFEYELFNGSILDRELVKRAVKGVDYVFHLAAMISVPESMNKPIECSAINTTGTLIVLEEAARAGVSKLILSSSAAVYGDNPVMPKAEVMVPEPKSPYAITKLDGEYYCRMFCDTGKLQTTCLRYFNVFGPRQNPRSQYAAAVPIFIERAQNDEPITIYGDGEQTRDFIYVKDVAAANAFFATQSPLTGVFNVAYGRQITVNELARTICEQIGSSSEILHLEERAGDIKHSVATVDKISKAGFVPENDFAEGMHETIQWYQNFMPSRTRELVH